MSDDGESLKASARLVGSVVSSFDNCAAARLRIVLQALVRHLHAFVVETALTEAEWQRGIELMTETGRICAAGRDEFVLWSDSLGISTLVDLLAHGTGPRATESTVRGPFWVPDSPWRGFGEAIAERPAGEPARVHGCVRDSAGAPVAGAVVDVWQNGADSLYGVQDPSAPPGHLRGRFTTDDEGRYCFLGVRPTPYRIPDDGPVGAMLRATGRGSWRPGHMHLAVTAPGFMPVTTHIFDAESDFLGDDAVFAVKPSLVRTFVERRPGEPDTPMGVTTPWFDVEFDIDLAATLAP